MLSDQINKIDLQGCNRSNFLPSFFPLSPVNMSSKGVALVTGSAQGIGRGIALRLAEDGFDVAVNDIPSKTTELASVAEEIRGKGRKAIVVAADVTVEDQVKGMVESTVKELGGLDVVSIAIYQSEL